MRKKYKNVNAFCLYKIHLNMNSHTYIFFFFYPFRDKDFSLIQEHIKIFHVKENWLHLLFSKCVLLINHKITHHEANEKREYINASITNNVLFYDWLNLNNFNTKL